MHYSLPYYTQEGYLQTAEVDIQAGQKAFQITPFHFRRISKKHYLLLADLIIWDGENIRLLRRGFGCNGISVPDPLDFYVERDDYLIAAFFHDADYLYHGGLIWRGAWVWFLVNKNYADRHLQESIHELYGVRWTKTFVIWFSVRVGGLYSYYWGTCNWNCEKCKWRKTMGCPYTFRHAPTTFGELK